MKRHGQARGRAGRRARPRLELLEQRLALASDVMPVEQVGHDHLHHHHGHDDHHHHHEGEWEQVYYSASGPPYFLDPADPQPVAECQTCLGVGEAAPVPATVDESAKVSLDQVPHYHSNPGAPNVFYLDFNGQVVNNTDWNRSNSTGQGNNGKPIHAVPYDTDGDQSTFNQTELDAIYEIWQRVSEDFIPFNIDVTTEEPPAEAFRGGRGAARLIVTTNVDDASSGGTGNVWAKGVGGIAFTASYWWAGDTPAWVFHNQIPRTPKAIAEAASHEFGHVLGLTHAGNHSEEYHPGTGEGETSWAPIMGAGYNSNVTQWTDGSYDGGRLTDNFATMTNVLFQVAFREDDHSEAFAEATPLSSTNGRVVASGIIETNKDLDTFSFVHLGGTLDLTVSPAAVGPNLDIIAELFSTESSLPIGKSAPPETLSCQDLSRLASWYVLLANRRRRIHSGDR